MRQLTDHFRRALEECDIVTVRKIWNLVAPGLPQPQTNLEVLATIHHARTGASSISLSQRAWSHRWLLDHGLPSAMPDHLKPRAERMYPKVVHAVGISINAQSKDMEPIAAEIKKAMMAAVEDAYADHQTEPGFIRMRMHEAKAKVLRR